MGTMATPEDEIKDLREKNNELVQKVQYWKMTAAQRENEKLDLMKEINELRLKLSRLRSGGAAQARKLDVELQKTSEEALNHLVMASEAVTRTIELAKTYMRDRQQMDAASPRWSNISGTPNERVHRVPPMMGGQSILQPVVTLSRAILNTSTRSAPRSPNQSQRNITERAVPLHMLQDVYIPLTRIDAADMPGQNMESDPETNNMNDSTEDLELGDSNEISLEESQNITEEDFEESRRLDAVAEDLEEEEEIETPPSRHRLENPLEGPSWLLDRPGNSKSSTTKPRTNLEPDSTTELEENTNNPRASTSQETNAQKVVSERLSLAFTPTVRRKRGSDPPPEAVHSPCPRPRRPSNSGRVLKVLIAKMRLDGDDDVSPPKRPALDLRRSDSRTSITQGSQPRDGTAQSRDGGSRLSESGDGASRSSQSGDGASRSSQSGDGASRSSQSGDVPRDAVPAASPARVSREYPRGSPSKKPVRFDAPSPNGSTDARVIVSELVQRESQNYGAGDAIDLHTSRSQSPQTHNVTARDSQRIRERDRDRSHSVMSRDSHDSDGGGGEQNSEEGRSRRQRKAITYKEKPLNRKLRR